MTDDLDKEFNAMLDQVPKTDWQRPSMTLLPIGQRSELDDWAALLSGPPQHVSFNCAGRPVVHGVPVLRDVLRTQHELDKLLDNPTPPVEHSQWDHLHCTPTLPREPKTLWQRFVLWIRNNVMVRWR